MDLNILAGYNKKWHNQTQEFRKLNKFKYNINDPITKYILEKLNIKNGFFIEFGAWNGKHNSNTKFLADDGWNGLYIEADIEKFNKLKKNYRNTNIICENIFIDTNKNKLDYLIKKYNIKKIDYLSIDIDGNDIKVFDSINSVLPTLVSIEASQNLYPMHKNYVDDNISLNNIHQSLHIYNQVFEKKGYKILVMNQDAFFIKKEFYHLFDVPNNLIQLYLNGLKLLPKVLWVYKNIEKYKFKNKIIEYIISKTNLLENKDQHYKKPSQWLVNNYDKIINAIKDLEFLLID